MGKFRMLTPDGFDMFNGKTYKSKLDAWIDFHVWKDRYRQQGYYGTIKGGRRTQIPLEYLSNYMSIIRSYKNPTLIEGVKRFTEFAEKHDNEFISKCWGKLPDEEIADKQHTYAMIAMNTNEPFIPFFNQLNEKDKKKLYKWIIKTRHSYGF